MPNILKSYRVLHGFTQEEFAEHLGIAASSYKQKENGNKDFKLSEIKKIQEIFNLSYEEIGKIFFTKEMNETFK